MLSIVAGTRRDSLVMPSALAADAHSLSTSAADDVRNHTSPVSRSRNVPGNPAKRPR